jgi:hypothetical protein
MDNKIKNKETINFISKNKKNKNGTQSSILNYFNSTQNDNNNINKSKREEHIINFSFENIKVKEKNNKSRKDIKSPDVKNKEKEKNEATDVESEDVTKLKNNRIDNKEISKQNKNIQNNINDIKNKNLEKEKPNLSKISKKNFNETLFDYKQYSLMNNNPIKKKSEFEKELKKTKKLKDMSMKKKKKLWIKINLLEKENDNNEFQNDKKIYLSKQNQKSKIINLNSINEEDSYKKGNQELEFGTESTEKDKDDKTDLNGNFFNYDKKVKKSQDDFGIDLLNKKSLDKESNVFIGKYKQYLKNKNSKKNKDFKKIKQNYESENDFKFFDDFIPND